jgi:hypothetical protein
MDATETLILRELVRDPRLSDSGVASRTGLNVRTVHRRRRRLEHEGILSYFTHVDLSPTGSGFFPARHLYTIRFRIGITLEKIWDDIRREPFVRTIFSEVIFESHLAEIDGQIALLLFVDGSSDAHIAETVQARIIPILRRNHGEDSIEEISTLRLLAPVRTMRTYLPLVNMREGKLAEEWPTDAIFVGQREADQADDFGARGLRPALQRTINERGTP